MATERDRKREETRRRLYKAALEIYRRDGVEAARIDDIAKAVGVSRGTFYFHFPTKEDVLVELLDSSQADISAHIEALPDDTPIGAILPRVAREIAAQWQDDPHILRELGTVALKLTARSLPESAREHAVRNALVPRFHRAAERGQVSRLVPPELMAEFFLVNLFATALSWCANPAAPLALILEGVVVFFLRGSALRPGD